MSEALKGKPSWNKGIPHTEESKLKISVANKGKKRSEEVKRKLSESHKGKNSWSKGMKFSEETKKKMSKSKQNRHWFNNGIQNIWTEECPEGFVRGRLKKAI